MLRATFRSLLARKLRLLLSATAVVLGVAFVAGALTLTDTLGRVFDDLFTSVNAQTDVQVQRPAGLPRPVRRRRAHPSPPPCCRPCAAVPGVARARRATSRATPSCSEGRHGLHDRRRADVRRRLRRRPAHLDLHPALGHRPAAAPTRWRSTSRPRTRPATGSATGSRSSWSPGRGSSPSAAPSASATSGSVGGASIVAFDTATAQALLGRPGEFEVLRLAGRRRPVAAAAARPRRRRSCPAGYQAITGEQSARGVRRQHQGRARLLQHLPARLRRGRAVRRRLPHLQHLLDPGRAAAARAGPAARARRQPPAGRPRACWSSRSWSAASPPGSASGSACWSPSGCAALVNGFGGKLPSGPLVVTRRARSSSASRSAWS